MNRDRLRDLLQSFREGGLSEDQFIESLVQGPLRHGSGADLSLDHHRMLRQGFGEAIFCVGKSVDQILRAARGLSANGDTVLLTRLEGAAQEAVEQEFGNLRVNRIARTAIVNAPEMDPVEKARAVIVSAGTADAPVAAEALETLASLGLRCEVFGDLGVAGLHRILPHAVRLRDAEAVIVVAGMDGALPSVVGGITGRPVIAVPTSIGYGVSHGGLVALGTMLSSCAAGVTVVNIDNGFGAAMAAARILLAGDGER